MNKTNQKSAIIIGSGLGGLSTALRLSTEGYDVTVIEKHSKAGGRLNQLKLDGFTFDVGPSFMSMSWELDELFKSNGLKNPIKLEELDPLYQVYFEGENKPYRIWKTLNTCIQKKCSRTKHVHKIEIICGQCYRVTSLDIITNITNRHEHLGGSCIN